MNHSAPSLLTLYISLTMLVKTFGSCPRCSSTLSALILSKKLSSYGHGVTSKSKTSSGLHLDSTSTFQWSFSFLNPQPIFNFVCSGVIIFSIIKSKHPKKSHDCIVPTNLVQDIQHN